MIRALEILMVNLGSISEAASQMGLRPCFTISEKKNTDHCVSTGLSVFDCIPITVCPMYSLTAGIILFKNCEFGFFLSHLVL